MKKLLTTLLILICVEANCDVYLPAPRKCLDKECPIKTLHNYHPLN